MIRNLIAAAVVGLALVAPAAATTIPISLNVQNNDIGFWTYSTTFDLPTGFSGAKLQITQFEVDDRAVLNLNGGTIASTGVFGPGQGLMALVSGGPNDAYTFTYGSRIGFTAFAPVTSGFVVGTNVLDFIVNNTGIGIFGAASDGGGPSDFQFQASVTYSVASGVPEPATWAMMLIGFAGLGLATHRRNRRQTI